MPSEKPVSAGLKTTFFAHLLIGAVVGLQHLFVPRLWTDLAGMRISETVTWRLIGAALVGLAAGSWMGLRATLWSEVRILVVVNILWSAAGAAVITWGILAEGLPPLEWLNALILGIFAVLFAVFYARHRTSG